MGLFGKIKASVGGAYNGASLAFRDTILPSPDRGNVMFLLPGDSRFYLNGYTRTRINWKAEWLWQNFGIVKGTLNGIARHSVGKGMTLMIDSEDHDFAMAAEDDFARFAESPDRCDLSGRRSFYEAQLYAIEQRRLRGEFFAVHAFNPRWNKEPCFQTFDANEVISGDQSDSMIIDGVKLDEFGGAVAYFVRTVDGKTKEVPASRMVHWYKPHSNNSPRGFSDLAQSVNPLVDIHELQRLDARTAKVHRFIALVMKGVNKKKTRGAFGQITQAAINQADPGSPPSDAYAASMESMWGGGGAGIAYFDDKEADVKLVTSNSPTPMLNEFVKDRMRDVCSGWDVPHNFFCYEEDMGSANTRFILSRADLFFQLTSDGCANHFCTPVAYRYLQARIASGKLQEPKDPNWSIDWQTPPRVTIDNGRDGKLLIEMLANGMLTLREYCAAAGKDYRRTMRQWIREPMQFLVMAKEEGSMIDTKTASKLIERWSNNMPLWRAGMPGVGNNAPAGTDADPGASDDGTKTPEEQEDETDKANKEKRQKEKDDKADKAKRKENEK